MNIVEKRGRYCVYTEEGVKKFKTEEDAKGYVESKKSVPFVENMKVGVSIVGNDISLEIMEGEDKEEDKE